MKIGDIKPNPSNPRTIKDEKFKKLVQSIKDFPQMLEKRPIVVDENMIVLGGNMRLKACKEAGLKEIPVIIAEDWTEDQKKEFIIKDNVGFGEWDWESLANGWDLQQLEEWGMDVPEFSSEGEVTKGLTDEDDVPEAPTVPVSKHGDLWILGNHRLMCGDSTSIDDVERLMNGQKADLLHTDPPYNVNYDNQDRPKAGKTKLGKIKNDAMDSESFYEFLFGFYSCAFSVLKDDSTAYVWHASSEHVNFTKAMVDAGFNYTQQIIWKKPMLLGRGRYQWAHEPCLMGVKGSPYFTDDRTKTTVWDFGGYDKSKNVHPTQKPLFIPEEAINNSSKQGSNILDLFGGSGSTLIACEKTGRKAYLMELDPKYCDVIIKRWQDFTGNQAILENDGRTFAEVSNASA